MSSLEEELAPLRIPLVAVSIATDNFAEVNLLKRGRKEDVYKGVLLSPWCEVDVEIEVIVIRGRVFKFHEEIKRLSRFNHRNAASLIGFCDEEDERMIVMEHVVNGSLDEHLSDPTFTWSQRLHICFGTALALSYWHENTPYFYKGRFRILLDKDWEAKVVFRIDSESENSDVYRLGVVLMEVLYGRKATIKDVFECLDKMRRKYHDGRHLDDIVHPNLRKQMHPESLSIFSELAHDCLKEQGYYNIVERLREAFEIQWKHENLLLVENFAYFKIPLSHIKLATNQFSHIHCIKSCIYESVYKGELSHFDRESGFSIERKNNVELPKKTVLINRIQRYKKIPKDFFAEIEILTSFTLYDYLRSTSNRTNLTWEKRMRICLGIAHGLMHLHNMEGKPSMIHHVIKSENVFLDENWTAKISNFRTWLSSTMDPPRAGQRHVVDDIYSLGILLFQILTGRLDYDPHASMAQRHFDEGKIKNMVDPRLMEEAKECSFTPKERPSEDSLNTFFKIAHQCVVETPNERPRLEDVIKSLEKALHFQYVMSQVQKLEHLKIPLEDIKAATESFDTKYRIGSGGYGEVYKAKLKIRCKVEDPYMPSTVAIKRITSKKDGQENEGFLVELDVVSKCKHPNIVSLLGFCVEDSEMLLVYELVSKGSLDEYLASVDRMIDFTWKKRLHLCIDIAQGLKHMHTTMECQNGIIHRDIKSANILLGENLEAKIADFGLSRVHHGNEGVSTINTQTLAGTDFYLDPEYARTGRLKKASDIYSFGVVLFEIFSGKLAYDSSYIQTNEKGLAAIARRHFKKGTLKEILDPKMMDDAHEFGFIGKVKPDHDSLNVFSRIAYECLAKTQLDRPTIEVINKELEKSLNFQENRIKTLNISLGRIKLGVEYFGCDRMLYKGKVKYNNRHQRVIVKRFSRIWYLVDSGLSSDRGFLEEFEVLFKYKHENIIGLAGYCNKMDEKVILYENASKGSLDRYLDDISFSWTKRLKICIDVANGLKFLHGGDLGQDVVIHRDIKSSNILLDKDCKAKICGFERALVYPSNQGMEIVYNIDNIKGSSGYMDPLYEETRILTKESDIYSFGVVLIEILCGGFGASRGVEI
ncbi:putative protein kinase RLK-Pelle-LRR-I-1 family [Helianthus debilis subsp. tardiflorus]